MKATPKHEGDSLIMTEAILRKKPNRGLTAEDLIGLGTNLLSSVLAGDSELPVHALHHRFGQARGLYPRLNRDSELRQHSTPGLVL